MRMRKTDFRPNQKEKKDLRRNGAISEVVCLGLELMNADVERMALDFGDLSREPIYNQSLPPDRKPFLSSSILYQGLGLVQAHSIEPPS